LVSDNSWRQMIQIKLGDVVRGFTTDKRIVGMEYIGEGDVVKFNVDQAHTYISDGLVSHNDKKRGGLIHRRYAQGGGIEDLLRRYAAMQQNMYAQGGGIYNLGSYSDGGRLLKGPGDGVSDDIPAQIGRRQPARLADGVFVIPARIVSELGNGSTDAGAKRLYAMMDRVQNNCRKSVGKGKVAVDSKAYKHLPV